MKIKMKINIVGPKGNGEESMQYMAGTEYTMSTNAQMASATQWLSDGNAEKSSGEKTTKVIKEMEKKEDKPKKKSWFKKKKK